MSSAKSTTTTVRRDIVRTTTAHKLNLLRKQKDLLKSCFESIETATSSSKEGNRDPVRTLQITAEHLKKLRLTNCERTRLSAESSLRFLKLHHPRPPPIGDLQKWQEKLEEEMKFLQRRTEHAVVFCDVIQEWLNEETQSTATDTPSEDKFDLLEDRGTSQERDFAPIPIRPFDPVVYLRENGIREDLIQEFSRIAGNVTRFGLDLLKPDYSITDHAVIEAMHAIAGDTRAYPPDVRAQLDELVKQPMIISELASSYTSTWNDIVADSWEWPESGISQIAQKHMSGKVRYFLQLDISVAIFLQVVGQTWSTFFSCELARARNLACWPKSYDLQNLRTGEERKIGNILTLLEHEQVNPSTHDSDDDDRNGNVDIYVAHGRGLGWTIRCNDKEEFGSILKPAGAPYRETSTGGEEDETQSPPKHWTSSLDAARTASSYDKVFRSITTDLALTRTVAPDQHFGVLHADLKDFGPSIPHQVSLSVLGFFGFPESWIKWYTTYLRIPIRNSDGQVIKANRGTPFGLKASTLVNELLLILLDVVVAQNTRLPLHRNHDDFWIWSSRLDSVTGSWDLLQDFTNRTGLTWNNDKSGFTLVRGRGTSAVPIPTPDITGLPSNKLKWGLLQLEQDGSWTFDEDLLRIQAEGLKSDLANATNESRSFLSIVNLWNRYQSYIVRNVGTPTPITGLDHLNLVARTLHRVQVLVLDSEDETVEDYLREIFKAHFPNHRSVILSEPVMIWPATLGGFQLHQHGLHALLQEAKLRDSQTQTKTSEPFQRSLEEAKQLYARISQAWISGFGDRAWTQGQHNPKSNLAEWVKKLGAGQKPPMVDEQTFLRWSALHADEWNDEYLEMSQTVGMDGDELADLAKKVYGPVLIKQFGEDEEELVPKELVPHYAVLDLAAATRQMFTVQ